MDKGQSRQVNYQLYPGEYPVVVFDYTEPHLHITDLSKVLNPIVERHKLELEKTIWLLYHPDLKWENEDFKYQFGRVSNHYGEISFTSRLEIIPQILFEGLLSRCAPASQHSIVLPDAQEWKQRQEGKRQRMFEDYPDLRKMFGDKA